MTIKIKNKIIIKTVTYYWRITGTITMKTSFFFEMFNITRLKIIFLQIL
jgi:hypothetical protein